MSRLFLSPMAPLRVFLVHESMASLFRSMVHVAFAIYLVRSVGLDPFQLVLVGTTLELTYFLCQVPTGIVADVYSRRWSVIVGLLLVGAGFVLLGLLPVVLAVFAIQIVCGVGEAFIDGALQAWVADEIPEADLSRVLLRGGQFGTAGGVVGTIGGVGFGLLDLWMPIAAGGAGLVGLGLWLIPAMTEHGWTPPPRTANAGWRGRAFAPMRGTLVDGWRLVRGSTLLVSLLAVGVIAGASSEAWDRLWEAHLLAEFAFPSFGGWPPIVWFGIIGLVGSGIGFVGTEVVLRRVPTGGHHQAARALLAITGVLLVATVLFAVAGTFPLALGALWVSGLARTLRGPIFDAWLNRHAESRIRATVLSLGSQADAFGQMTGGPMIGGLGSLFGIRVAIAATGLALAPAMALFARLGRSDQPEVVPVRATAAES